MKKTKEILSIALSMSIAVGSFTFANSTSKAESTTEQEKTIVICKFAEGQKADIPSSTQPNKIIKDFEKVVELKISKDGKMITAIEPTGKKEDVSSQLLNNNEVAFSGKTAKPGPAKKLKVTKSIPIKELTKFFESKKGDLNKDKLRLKFIANDGFGFNFDRKYNELVNNGPLKLNYIEDLNENSDLKTGIPVDAVLALKMTDYNSTSEKGFSLLDGKGEIPRLYAGIRSNIENYQKIANFGLESPQGIEVITFKDVYDITLDEEYEKITEAEKNEIILSSVRGKKKVTIVEENKKDNSNSFTPGKEITIKVNDSNLKPYVYYERPVGKKGIEKVNIETRVSENNENEYKFTMPEEYVKINLK